MKNLFFIYDAFGNESGIDANDQNPFRYCGEWWDKQTKRLYLRARDYDAATGRFTSEDTHWNSKNSIYGDNAKENAMPNIAAIKQSSNLYAYCGNNPILYRDPSGNAWWHWAIAAAIVVVAAAAVIVTAGGALPAVAAVACVANGVAAATTASTIAAGAFIGASTALAGSAMLGVMGSNGDLDNFYAQGDWSTVAGTVIGSVLGAAYGYTIGKNADKYKINWNKNIKATQENIEGTNIPKSFIMEDMEINGKQIWVHGNATKHMGEFVGGYAKGSTIVENELMNSFREALFKLLQKGISGKMIYYIDGWEIGINADTGVIYHALFN